MPPPDAAQRHRDQCEAPGCGYQANPGAKDHDPDEPDRPQAVARRFHNLAIEEYNTALRMFPANIIATKLRMNSRQPYDLGVERTLIDEPMAMQF